ncbi:MAG TPA: ATP-dependent DNA helicase [Acidimicrobiia bacterium]|nr:ATP-dependent DNA helicase [Acidimicrobiia bacterium]
MRSLIPSPEQAEILSLGPDSIRIRAGAGTGKTTTVAMVISNLITNHYVDPERILGITFTNKAASELADRVRSTITGIVDEGRQIEVHTYHGFAAQVLFEFGALVGVDNRVKVITPTFSRQILAETFDHTTYQHLDITNRMTLDRIRGLGDRLGDHLLEPGDLLGQEHPDDETWDNRNEMLQTLLRYSEDKRRLGVVDYADLVTLSTRIFRTHPGLAGEIRDRYQVVVLDEYQDTNPGQRVLLTTIFGEGFPVIAVGDEDQTIYEWRGASSENFELFPLHFRAAGGGPPQDRSLTLNRRSSQTILDVANEIRRKANPAAELLLTSDPEKEGQVITYWAGDALAEADWIARRFEELHDDGVPFSEMAVLFRKNKDFAVVVDAMARNGIPVEVANVGGLLSVPEVAELRSWLTVIERPENSAALVEILFGSRYRLGLADIAPLSLWVSAAEPVRDREEENPITLLEAIEDIDRITGIRDDARSALRHFLGLYRTVLTESQGMSLVETCRLILDRTRAWQDIEALPGATRLTARLNLHRLLDLAEDWSPLIGRPSLEAFLDYLGAMEDEPAEELDSAHLSGEDAVTLVTVHRAKGLEWDVVAIPAVTDQNFPSRARQHPDPDRFAEYLPVQNRIDTALADMPDDEAARQEYLKARNDIQEWRTAYVAATRARSLLMVTGAYWYGLPEPTIKAKKPSPLFELVESHPATHIAGHEVEPARPALLRRAPDAATPDPVFEQGWDGGLRLAMSDHEAMSRRASELGAGSEFDQRVDELVGRLFELAATEQIPQAPQDQRTVSVTGLVTYAQCPKRFYWSAVDPLPRGRSPSAVAGTELHRRIELHQRGQVPFEQFSEDLYDVPDEAAGDGGFNAFRDSRFAERRAALVEAPFELLAGDGYRVRGRIDAVYVDGRHWEVVDFKSGRPSTDPSRIVQLQSYAMAATDIDFGHPAPEELDATFAYLGGGLVEDTYRADAAWIEEARSDITTLIQSIDDKVFIETPGDWCHTCDFLRFCGPGKAWLAE